MCRITKDMEEYSLIE